MLLTMLKTEDAVQAGVESAENAMRGFSYLSDLRALSWLLHSGPGRRFWRDPLLLGALLFCAVILSHQLAVTLLRPAWGGAVTDWLRGTLALPEWLIVAYVSWWFSRTRRPEARAWWMLSTALLFYTVARVMWTIENQLIFPGHVPFPSLPDFFFMAQYPFYFLAVMLIPSSGPWGSRVKLMLDGMLIMGAAAALSWYFLLLPLYLQERETLPAKLVTLYYPAGDLVILFGLTITFIYHRSHIARQIMMLLIAAFLCLVTADSWVGWLIAATGSFTAGTPPDLFWIAFYLLLPLTSLVGLRLTQQNSRVEEPKVGTGIRMRPQWRDFKEVVWFLFPFLAALLASALIAERAIVQPLRPGHPLVPVLVIFTLLMLVMVRQGITLLENAQLRREHEAAQASELAMREANRQMETFLGMASHELKTPLTSIIMGLQLIQRRARQPMRPTAGAADQEGRAFMTSQETLLLVEQQATRLNRLVNDLLDISRIRAGQLTFNFQRADLADIVRQAVDEQRRLAPHRTFHLRLPDEEPVPVWADAERIGQAVTNYLTNAHKYSLEGYPIEVGVEVREQRGRVWVRDYGPGIPRVEQAHIWERFHQAPGIEVQSGSGIGLGLGLYITKTIIEHHHGQVGVESLPGQGALFWFALPLSLAPQNAK